jgi:basic amino acid/polyamine antiporter, APA family
MRMIDARSEDSRLPRQLGLWSAVSFVIGTTIGSGIFRSPAGIADKLPGTLPLIAVWVTGGLFALCGALTYAEMSGAYPQSGGVYAFLREGWGRLAAFLFGWSELVLICAASLGAISLTFAEYFVRVLGHDPAFEPYSSWAHYIAALAIIVVGFFNYIGLRWASLVQNITTIAKFGALLLIALFAFTIALPAGGEAHFQPMMPPEGFSIAPFGLALVSVLWVYDGWGDLTFLGGEVKEPRKNLPRALIIGTLGIIGIYVIANLAYMSVLSIEEMRHSKLVAADVAERLVGAPGVMFVAMTVMLSTFGTLNGSVLGRSRIFFAMADDGLLHKRIASVHPQYKTPHVAILLQTILGVTFVLLGTFEQLADAFVTAIVPFYALAVAAIFVLRRRPGYNPPFRVPGYPIVPILFILATVYLLANAIIDPASRIATLVVLGVILIGIPVYFATVGRKTSQT